MSKKHAHVSHGTVTVNGEEIRYTATAGNIILKDDKGQPQARMFYVAYTRDDAKAAERPVTFAYNGGPGGSSVLSNIGGLGPKRVKTSDPVHTPPPPYTLEDNPFSLLDKSDLVFIDAVGTGESKLLGKTKGKAFWGVDADAESFSRFIRKYVTKNQRWNSPKFLMGESYGTPRSAILARLLQEQGVAVNGLVLISCIFDFNNEFWFQPPGSSDLSFELYLPTYAATAWYHGKLPSKPDDLGAFLDEVRAFAIGDYDQALKQGDSISDAARDAVLGRLSAYTGLSEAYLRNANLRVTPERFRKELLRAERRTLGRFDSRYEGIDQDAAGECPATDPSGSAMFPAIATAFHSYLNEVLQYPGADDYTFLNMDVNKKWDWHHKVGEKTYPVPNTLPDLRTVMAENPHMKVFAANGYYDLATPFFKTDYELNHMGLDPSLRGNITCAYYQVGHMIYIDDDGMRQMHEDLVAFYDSAT